MKYAPKKVFVLENNIYVELTYDEFNKRKELMIGYENKLFLPLHGVLMEVSEENYKDYYRIVRRQKYIEESSKRNGAFSYDALTTENRNGEDVLVDIADIAEEVEKNIMAELLRRYLLLLPEEEQTLIMQLYYYGYSERQLAKEYGLSQVAIHKRKNKILAKLKKLLEN